MTGRTNTEKQAGHGESGKLYIFDCNQYTTTQADMSLNIAVMSLPVYVGQPCLVHLGIYYIAGTVTPMTKPILTSTITEVNGDTVKIAYNSSNNVTYTRNASKDITL